MSPIVSPWRLPRALHTSRRCLMLRFWPCLWQSVAHRWLRTAAIHPLWCASRCFFGGCLFPLISGASPPLPCGQSHFVVSPLRMRRPDISNSSVCPAIVHLSGYGSPSWMVDSALCAFLLLLLVRVLPGMATPVRTRNGAALLRPALFAPVLSAVLPPRPTLRPQFGASPARLLALMTRSFEYVFEFF